jgi:hypothetical protein
MNLFKMEEVLVALAVEVPLAAGAAAEVDAGAAAFLLLVAGLAVALEDCAQAPDAESVRAATAERAAR